MEQKPLVSVRLMVYNNEPYIREAVESILMQKTEFRVEIVVGDDFSTDNTLKIIRSYEDTEKINIRILDRPVGGEYWRKRKSKNASVRTNFIDIVENCHGKYVALLDGDDYWTDPLKLQKQVDFMEANPEYAICFHEVQIFNQQRKSLEEDTITKRVLPTTESIDLAQGNYIHTPSVLFRNDFNIPNWFSKSPLGDWTLYMLAATNGKVYKIEDTMAVYRQHEESIWSKKSNEYRISNTLKSFRIIDENLVLTEKAHHVLKETINLYKKQLYNLRKKTANTLVSICIPTYNGASFLEESLESVKRQTYNNIEVIVSDDASIDDTLAIVKKFKDGVDFPVTIISHKPNGIGANWNHCIKHAKGAYIKFLFQDDVLMPNCIEEMLAVFAQYPKLGLVGCKREFIIESETTAEIKDWINKFKNLQVQFEKTEDITFIDNTLFSRRDFTESPMNKIGEPPTVMFKKEIINEVGLFDEKLEQILDYVFYYRILKDYPIAIINKSLVKFRIHKNQATNVNRNKPIADYEIYKKILYREFLPLLHPSHKKKLVLKFSKTARLKKKVKSVLRKLRP